jgi:phosphatidate cytidylyltransferase
MILKRIITALVGMPLVILIILGTNELWFFLLVLVVAALGLAEFFSMALAEEDVMGKRIGVFLGCGVVFSAFLDSQIFTKGMSPPFLTTGFFVISIFVFFSYHITFGKDKKESLSQVVLKVFGIAYIALLLSYTVLLRPCDDGPKFLLLLLCVTWAGDTGAYFIGSLFGRHPLCPDVSPKKTIEGAVSSFVSGTMISFLFCMFFMKKVGVENSVALGMGINVMNQFGDLSESLIKRTFNVKDSGNLLPGHGGMLDRMDSILFAAPFLFYYIDFFLKKP